MTRSTLEIVEPVVRWFERSDGERVLQQLRSVYENGLGSERRSEWRDVPVFKDVPKS